MCLAVAGTHATSKNGMKVDKGKRIQYVNVSTKKERVQMSTMCNVIRVTSTMRFTVQHEADHVRF